MFNESQCLLRFSAGRRPCDCSSEWVFPSWIHFNLGNARYAQLRNEGINERLDPVAVFYTTTNDTKSEFFRKVKYIRKSIQNENPNIYRN